MAKTINLTFEGYWREVNSASIPNNSGIYLVYCCVKTDSGISIRKLIYIGESGKVKDRIEEHKKKTECWNNKLLSGEVLCYSFALIASPDREQAEAALIFKHKPVCNDEYVDNFPYEETTVTSSGKCTDITQSFTVNKTL